MLEEVDFICNSVSLIANPVRFGDYPFNILIIPSKHMQANLNLRNIVLTHTRRLLVTYIWINRVGCTYSIIGAYEISCIKRAGPGVCFGGACW